MEQFKQKIHLKTQTEIILATLPNDVFAQNKTPR
jgi:hypothetical protein